MNHYPDSRNGGIENVTKMLSQEFHRIGWCVDVAFLYESHFDHSDDSNFCDCRKVDIDNIKDEVRNWIIEKKIDAIINRCVIFASPLLKAAIGKVECKLITTYNNKPTLAPPTLKELSLTKNTPILKSFLIKALYPLFCKRSIFKLRKRHQRSYEVSDATVLLSDYYVPEYSELMRVGSQKLVVINNPIKNGMGISNNDMTKKEKIILMVTRLDETQKCILKALKIWNNIRLLEDEWKLVIVGSGPDEDMIKSFTKSNRIRDVEFIQASDPTEYYKRASIFLMTSRNEGWPNTINEAMRMGCVPIVLATFSAVYDMVDDSDNGYIIPCKDEKNDIRLVSEKLLMCMKNSTKRMELANNAIIKTQRLSIDKIAGNWVDLICNRD